MSGNYHASEQFFWLNLCCSYITCSSGETNQGSSVRSHENWLVASNDVLKPLKTAWWFGTFFLFFPYIGNNNPNWRTHSIPQVMVGFPGHAELTLIPWIWIFSGITIWNLVCWWLFFSVFFLRIDAKSDVSLNLFGGLGTWFIFPYGNVIIPTDFHSIISEG